MKFIRASNTKRIIGWRGGPICVLHGSQGTVNSYRNGLIIHYGKHVLGFVPLTKERELHA